MGEDGRRWEVVVVAQRWANNFYRGPLKKPELCRRKINFPKSLSKL